MKVTIKEVEHIAELSRINFTENEKVEMQSHLTNMLTHFATLAKQDTASVKATAHILDNVNVLREDVAAAPTDRALLLKNAVDNDGECYIVPRVLE